MSRSVFVPLPTVRADADLQRILALPERAEGTPIPTESTDRIQDEVLETSRESMTLRYLQALCLHESQQRLGLIAALGVGEGKTLPTMLYGKTVGAERILLLQPASLIKKTLRDRDSLVALGVQVPPIEYPKTKKARDGYAWKPGVMCMVSYEAISNVANVGLLERLNPDCIVCDEAHALKDRKSVVTQATWKFVAKRQHTLRRMFASGSFIQDGIWDIAHIFAMALCEKSPLPLNVSTTRAWASALDHFDGQRTPLGALKVFGPDLVSAREGLARRMRTTTGCVFSDTKSLGVALNIDTVKVPLPHEVRDALKLLRTNWELPDGEEFSEASELARHVSEMALGFYRTPDGVRGPEEWYEARREWNRHVRHMVRYSCSVDSMGQLRARYLAMGDKAPSVFLEWERLKNVFKPSTKPVWLSEFALDYAREWMARGPGGLVWCMHTPVGKALDWYWHNGINERTGEYVEDARGRSLALSLKANYAGRNLQHHWYRNLYLGAFDSTLWWEQSLGRTHRSLQPEPVVEVEVMANVPDVERTLWGARDHARTVTQDSGVTQKLCLATWL